MNKTQQVIQAFEQHLPTKHNDYNLHWKIIEFSSYGDYKLFVFADGYRGNDGRHRIFPDFLEGFPKWLEDYRAKYQKEMDKAISIADLDDMPD